MLDFDESEIEIVLNGPIPEIHFSDQLEHSLVKAWNR